ncbi:ABC transporter substrate-binding protein, partial [Neisseria sp. P0017.S006]
KDMWGAIADTAGGNNIAAPYVKNWGPINPEKFLTSKPDVIVISGTENGHKDKPGIMAMGIGISQADAQRRLAGFVKRKG